MPARKKKLYHYKNLKFHDEIYVKNRIQGHLQK